MIDLYMMPYPYDADTAGRHPLDVVTGGLFTSACFCFDVGQRVLSVMAEAHQNIRTVFTCFKCARENVVTNIEEYRNLTLHFRHVHGILSTSGKSIIPLVCNQNGCPLEFFSWSSYRHHLIHCQRPPVADERSNTPPVNPETNDASENQQNDSGIGHMDVDDEPGVPDDDEPGQPETAIDLTLARLTLSLRADHFASHTLLDHMANGLHLFVQQVADASARGDLNQLLSTTVTLDRLNTQKKRRTFYKHHFDLPTPEELILGHSFVDGGLDEQGRPLPPKQKSEKAYYIPIRFYLKALFSNENFCGLYFNSEPSADDYIRSYRDTPHFKRHALFIHCRSGLIIQLFFDEVEVVNPLGSKTKKHELGMFYFRILNLPNELNSLLSHIFTIAVVPSKLLNQNTFDIINQRIMKEIRELESEEGVNLMLNDRPEFKLRGTLASFCADTKGAHQIFGLMGPGATYFCRLCLIKRSDILDCKTLSSVEMRTKDNHEEALTAVREQAQKSSKGVVYDCALNRSRYFHSTENKVLDAMHDLLEGVCPFIIMLCLRDWITNRILPENPCKERLSADLLNRRIQSFRYSFYDMSDKPSAKFTDAAIREPGNYTTKQRALQQWCLIRNLPFLIADLIPSDNERFQLILQLLDIMDVIFAPRFLIEHTVHLEYLIEDFFEDFATLFPHTSPINKFHHLLHYPDTLRIHGPGRQNWTARFEAKHNQVKRIARENFNFKNISFSVAEHQLEVFCSEMQSPDAFAHENVEFAPVNIVPFESLQVMHDHPNLDQRGIISITKSLTINGWSYRPGSIIVLKFSHETKSEIPKFGRVKTVFMQQEKRFAVLSVLMSKESRRLHAYQVWSKVPEKVIIIELKDFMENEPLWPVKTFENTGKEYVSPRNFL